ncbi:MAG: zinc ABC transporter substrate-binding protein [Treponema sp.]|jgi:zinc transport system substrate-binding protein|nr:zinc ABC transporter substrate-binding protein [Treponema sp.]
MNYRFKSRLLVVFTIAVFLCCACSRRSPASQAFSKPPAARPLVVVSILPQSWFVSRVGGDRVDTMVLVGPGQDPHNYEPSPRQMQDLAKAGVWILSGTEFEISLKPKISALFPKLPLVDGTAGVRFRSLEEDDEPQAAGTTHSLQNKAEGLDRHTWLGEEPAKIMAAHIRDTLSIVDPEGATLYEANYAALIGDIEGEFARLREALAPLKGSTAFVYHPAFGYFLDEFGIEQRAIEAGGKEPGPRDILRILDDVRREGARVIFVQAQFPVETARSAANAAGVTVASLDPLAEDWLANIRSMGAVLRDAALQGAKE